MWKLSSYRFYAFVIGVHLVYFIAAQYFKGFFLIDSYGYVMQASNIWEHQSWYAEDWNARLLPDYFSIRPPLYAWCIGLLQQIGLGINTLLLLQNLLSIVNLCLVFWFAHRYHLLEKKSMILLYAAVLFYPAQMVHANFVMTEILFQSFLLWLFLTCIEFYHKPRWSLAIGIGVILSLSLLLKPISLFLPIVSLGIMMISVYKQKSKMMLLSALVLPLFTFHIICKQNEHATGYYHYSSIKNINNLKYNARYTLMHTYNEAYADSVIANTMQQANAQEHYQNRMEIMDSTASAILLSHPISAAYIWSKGVIAFLIDPGRFDLFHFFTLEKKGTIGLMHEIQSRGIIALVDYLKQAPLAVLSLLLVSFIWNLIILYQILLFIFHSFKQKYVSAIAAIAMVLVVYIAVATGPVGVSRYKVPVYPLLLIISLVSLYPAQSKKYA